MITILASWTDHMLPILANYSQWLSGFTLLGGAAAIYHRHNCHEARCWRLVRHGKTHCPRHEQ